VTSLVFTDIVSIACLYTLLITSVIAKSKIQFFEPHLFSTWPHGSMGHAYRGTMGHLTIAF